VRFFSELADNAPVMIWRSGPDKLCDWFNKPSVDFDDFERCLKTYVDAFDARQRFSMMYRLRRAGGVYRAILDNGARD
jgi:hypothetical protein